MSQRNERFDESLEVLRGAWGEVPFAYSGKFAQRPGSAEEHRDHLADAGVDSFVLRPPGDSVDHAVEALHQYAEMCLKG